MATLDQKNIVSPEELQEILTMQVTALLEDPSLAHFIPPLMVWGPPGAGKSSIIKQVAKEKGIDIIDYRLSQVEPVDLRGLPVPNKEDKSVEWFPTGEFPRDPKSKGILLFDEITAADRSLQVAAYELILDRRLGKLYSLPPGWLVVAAGNRTEDRAVATTMSSALANRFMHVEINPDASDWLKWALMNDIHPAVQGFIRYKPMYLFSQEHQNLERGWPSPRSWERVSTMCKIYTGKNQHLVNKFVNGCVGPLAGVEFMSFWKISKEFDNILEYMTNPKLTLQIPEENDRKHAICSAMVYLLWRGKDENDEKARIDGFFRISNLLPSDFATMAMTMAMLGTDKKLSGEYATKLYNCPRFVEWQNKFGEAFAKRAKRKF